MPGKLGPLVTAPSGDLARFIEAGCPALTLVGHFELAPELVADNPGLLIVGRAPAEGRFTPGRGSPESAAREFVERQRELMLRHPSITYWAGPHEPALGDGTDPADFAAMEWYAAFESERLRALADLGRRGAAGSFATGTPGLALWPAFVPALDAVLRHNGCLSLHEYASPFIWSLTGLHQLENCDGRSILPGEGDTGWHTLRYRKAYRDFLIPNGFGAVPLIITAGGLGPVPEVCPGQTNGAWRAHLEFWQAHDGETDPIDYWRGSPAERDPERYCAEQLIWYERRLMKDDYVLAATICQLGPGAPGPEFDLEGTRVADFLMERFHLRQVAADRRRLALPADAPRPAFAEEVVTTRLPPGADGQPLAFSTTPNLLINAGFEDGQSYFYDVTRERAVPIGWALTLFDDDDRAPGQASPFGLPITALINHYAVVPAERGRVFAGGVFCWKVCGATMPLGLRLGQVINGLTPGARYQFAANLLPDAIVQAGPPPVYAADPFASEARLIAEADNFVIDSGWQTGSEAPFGRYTRLALDFTAPSDHARLALELRSRGPLPLGAWYVDELSLTAL